MTDLVERESCLATIHSRLMDTVNGKGHALLVCGEAGIGKTSVMRQAVEDHPSISVWWGACDALETPHPLAPLRDIARSVDVGFRRLLDSPTTRVDLFEAVIASLRAVGPTLMVIEDAHWADESTLDLLKFIGRRIETLPAVLAVTYRDDEVGQSHPLRRVIGYLPPRCVTRVELPPLSPAGVEVLARHALRAPEGLHALTRGNPFFLTELLRQSGDGIPHSVEDLVLARLYNLPERAQEIVRLASIVPARFERWLMDELLSPTIADLESCLDCGLLLADEGSLFFRHDLARVAVEASLSLPMAQAMNANVLAALARCGYEGITPARIVHHAARANDAHAVLKHAPDAARLAIGRCAHREAAAHYRTALAFAGGASEEERLDWLESYAVESLATNELRQAIEAREQIRAILSGRGKTLREAENHSQLAMLFVLALRNAEADAANRRAIELAETLPPSVQLASAYRVESQLRMLNRDIAESVKWGEKAIEVARRFDDKRVLAAAHGTLGAGLLFLDHEAGLVHLERALDIALAENFDYIAANCHSNLGTALGELFRLREAERYLEEAIQFSTRNEIDFYRNYAMAWLALCDLLLGRWEDAEAHAMEVLSLSSEPNTTRVMALCALGKLRVRRGDASEEVLDEALDLAIATQTLQRIAPVRLARAEAAFARGDSSAVLAESKAALEMGGPRDHPWFVGEIAYWMRKSGSKDAVRARCAEPYALQLSGKWREAANAWERLDCPYERARALAEGDREAQLEALAIYERLGAKPAAGALRDQLRTAGIRGVPRGARASTLGNPHGLTQRELEVLKLLCSGLKNSEIAARLHRSVRTVDHHVDSVLRKLGVNSRTEALAAVSRDGLLDKIGSSA
jgi:predicted ATPase/DNA-binding CsgD family transcriptional regulator